MATTVELSSGALGFESLGEAQALSALVRDQTGAPMPGAAVRWSSASPEVASVSASGVVTSISNGSSLVRAQSGSASASATVSVAQVAADLSVGLADLVFTAVGQDSALSVDVRDALGSSFDGAPVTWSSSAPSTASVSSQGVVRAEAEGVAIIRATAGPARDSVRVQVMSAAVEITTTSLPDGEPGVAYDATVEATGGVGGITFAIGSGALPDGLNLDPGSGRIAGTPVAEGISTFQVTATDGATADSLDLSITVEDGARPAPEITAVSPAELVEGQTAVILGTGFGGTIDDNEVRLGGTPLTILSATGSRIEFEVPLSDCLPTRTTGLALEVSGSGDSVEVVVRPEEVLSPAVGQGSYDTRCLRLDPAAPGARYMVGLVSTSETPSSVTPARFETVAGSAVAVNTGPVAAGGGALGSLGREGTRLSPVGPSSARPSSGRQIVDLRADPGRLRHARAEARIRASERELLARLGRSALGSGLRPGGASRGPDAAPPTVGDTLAMKVPRGCTSFTAVEAVTRHVGNSLVFMEDVANPVQDGLSLTAMQELDALYQAAIGPTLDDYFGEMSDIDANGRLLVLLTREVNAMDGVNGFVWSGDFYPMASCTASNEAEVFYGLAPDPTGSLGRTVTAAEIESLYPALIAHEATHVIQVGRQMLSGAGSKATWEMEGGATLAEQLTGFAVEGHGPGQNLGIQEILDAQASGGWFAQWPGDAAHYFGFTGSGKVVGAPERCSWAGRESEGNTGPCISNRAPYGVPSIFLRMVLDVYGPGYPGGEAALMRDLTGGPFEGLRNIAEVTGQPEDRLLVLFSLGLWADERVGDWFPTWDFRSVMDAAWPTGRLAWSGSTALETSRDFDVRALSTAYMEWSPTGGHPAVALRLRDLAGAPGPDGMRLWVLRIQ